MTRPITEQLTPIFAPKSLALIGASNVPHKWGFQTLQRLLAAGYKGSIYPVNPREKEILGLKSYPRVLDITEPVDLAILTVPAQLATRAMGECVQKGVKGAIIISADFAETGDRGRALQAEMTLTARQGGLRFVGPNCFGVWNAAAGFNTLPVVPPEGEIGFISQSGSLTHIVARIARNRGYGLSKLVSVGNQADLDVADYLAYMADDPHTKAIGMYLEGFDDGRKLFDEAKRIAGNKPVVVYKTGKNPGSARVALSHTAAMIGQDRVFDAMCRQAGIMRAENLVSALDMAAALVRQPLLRGNRVGIQGSGGQCMILTDTCISMGMEVPELRQQDADFVIDGIGFPAHAPAPKNPIDFAGSHTALMDASVINRLAQLDTIDGIISNRPVTFHQADAPSTPEQDKGDEQVGRMIAEVPRKYGKPLVLIDPSSLTGDAFLAMSRTLKEAIEAAGILLCPTPEDAVRAMGTLLEFSRIRKRFTEGAPWSVSENSIRVPAPKKGGSFLNNRDAV